MASPPHITFYDLYARFDENKAAEPTPFSPNTLNTRMALNFKRIPFKTEWVEFADIDSKFKALNMSPNDPTKALFPYTVPVIQVTPSIETPGKDAEFVMESDAIADYLDRTFPARLLLRGTTESIKLQRELISMIKNDLSTSIRYLCSVQICQAQNPRSAEYYRRTRERSFGLKLEDLIPRKETSIGEVEGALLKLGRFIDESEAAGHEILSAPVENDGESEPTYAAMVTVAVFRWLQIMGAEGAYERVMKFGDGRWKGLYSTVAPYF